MQLVARPDGELRAGDFRVVEVRWASPAPGEVLVRNTWTSVDPGLQAAARRAGPGGLLPAFALGAPLDGILTVGEVIESRADGFAPGDIVWHASGWRDYAVVVAGDAGARRARRAHAARHRRRAAAGVPRTARRHGPDRVRRPVRRGRPARGRRRLGVGGGGRGRQPRGAVRQAPRASRDRQRRVATRRSASCATSSASTRPSTTARARSPSC